MQTQIYLRYLDWRPALIMLDHKAKWDFGNVYGHLLTVEPGIICFENNPQPVRNKEFKMNLFQTNTEMDWNQFLHTRHYPQISVPTYSEKGKSFSFIV